jgi:hypothetical protein
VIQGGQTPRNVPANAFDLEAHDPKTGKVIACALLDELLRRNCGFLAGKVG